MKLKKIDREFLLTDNSVNSYGFRLLTDGYLIDEFKKNPIGYLMHERHKGVLVKWEDLRVDGDKVYGKPVINMSNERAQQTCDEIEAGFLNAASVGHLVVLEYSDDPSMKLAGQTGVTVTKWFNRECSLVDVPGNFNAIALYDKDEQPLNLSDFTKTKLPIMNKPVFTGAMLAAINLKDDADQNTVEASIQNLVAKAAKVEGLEQEIKNLKDASNKEKIASLIASGIADKKLTVEVGNKLSADYANNPDGLKNLIDALPVTPLVTSQLGKGTPTGEALAAKSWDELHELGKLEDLKAQDPELYKDKFKKAFGHEPVLK